MGLIIRSTRVMLAGDPQPADVVIEEGRVVDIGEHGSRNGDEVVDVGDSAVLPGLVDTHVHVNEPGRTEWEGFECATRAAAAGGVTTVVDMPLNSLPPTVDADGLEQKIAAADGRCWVDVGFWGGAVPDRLGAIPELLRRGARGVKAFLSPSGVEEFPSLDEESFRRAAGIVAEAESVLLVHAELPGPLESAIQPEGVDWSDPLTYLASRPEAAEEEAARLVVEVARTADARLHVVHLASGRARRVLEQGRREGARISVETCPHYLMLSVEDIPQGATEFKCAPPIRTRENRLELWTGLERGSIDMVVSDHSPSPPELKRLEEGSFETAWGGISSLQLSLPVTWTAGRPRGIGLSDISRWMSAAPARLAGLENRKGSIEVGKDADLVVFDPKGTFLVEPELLEHRHPLSPYADRLLTGIVEMTLLSGEIVFDRGNLEGPAGSLLVGEAA